MIQVADVSFAGVGKSPRRLGRARNRLTIGYAHAVRNHEIELTVSCKAYHRVELVKLYKMTGLLSVFVIPEARTRTFRKIRRRLLAAGR